MKKKAYDKHLRYTRNNKGKTNMIKESEHRLSIMPSEFDKVKEHFNCMNGVINLRNGQLFEHDYNQYLSKISRVEYTNKIDAPMWQEFLNQIFDNDRELIDYIQKAVGYSMSGSTKRAMCILLLWER